jgi:plasmid stabilization system protein ParE
MAYLVKIASRAERDLASLYSHIKAAESGHARQWYFDLKAAILGLGEMPNRHQSRAKTHGSGICYGGINRMSIV